VDVEGEGSPRTLDDLRLEVEGLRASRARLALAADAERRSFERSLHDGVQQLLVTIAADIELVAASVGTDPAAATTLLSELRRDLQRALEEARDLAARIYPPLLDAGGLGVALRSAAADADRRIRIEVALESDHSPATVGAVYFCCVDVISRADPRVPVTVKVRADADALTFEITAKADLSDTLASHDRVHALGGRLDIRDEAGGGIRLTGVLPTP
jgi:signal transduction histidine kinase